VDCQVAIADSLEKYREGYALAQNKNKNKHCVEFGKMVRRLREEQGYSQEAFADYADIHRTYMGGIERGERNPTLTTIYRLAAALNVPPNKLLRNKKI